MDRRNPLPDRFSGLRHAGLGLDARRAGRVGGGTLEHPVGDPIAIGSASIAALALLFDVVPLIAILSGWTFAFAHVVWLRGTYADVHPVGFAVAFVAFALAVAWTLRGDARALVSAIVLAGFAVAIDTRPC